MSLATEEPTKTTERAGGLSLKGWADVFGGGQHPFFTDFEKLPRDVLLHFQADRGRVYGPDFDMHPSLYSG